VELHDVEIGALVEAGRRLYGSPVVAERTASVGEAVAAGVEGLDPVGARIVAAGAEMSAVDAYRGEYELTRLRAAASELWETIDALALPTTPRAPTLAEVAAEPVAQNDELGRFTTFVNLLDLAAIVVPVQPGVPAALQLIAAAWSDDELVRVATGLTSGSLEPADQPCTVVVIGAHLSGLPLNFPAHRSPCVVRRQGVHCTRLPPVRARRHGTAEARSRARRQRSGGAHRGRDLVDG
jgi:Asp-tRNA(Asn)/Glu-tRNA(Gln) amidotransferase A subunit family amidase